MAYCKSWLTNMSSRPFLPRRRGELLLELLQVTRGRDGGPRNVLVGPADNLPEHREQLGALPGQAVLMANRIALIGLLRHQAGFFQPFQPVSQDVGGNALVRLHEFPVQALAHEKQVAHHQQRPLVAQNVQGVGDGAGGAGGADTRGRFALLHGCTVPPGVMTCKCKVTDLEWPLSLAKNKSQGVRRRESCRSGFRAGVRAVRCTTNPRRSLGFRFTASAGSANARPARGTRRSSRWPPRRSRSGASSVSTIKKRAAVIPPAAASVRRAVIRS